MWPGANESRCIIHLKPSEVTCSCTPLKEAGGASHKQKSEADLRKGNVTAQY